MEQQALVGMVEMAPLVAAEVEALAVSRAAKGAEVEMVT